MSNNPAIAFIKTIRPLNLFIIALTQCLAYFFVVVPAYSTLRLSPLLTAWQFLLLVIITMLTAAGGYLLNDYLDQEVDDINKKGKNLVGSVLSAGLVHKTAIGLFIAAVVLGLGFGITIGSIRMGLVFLFPVALLWAYNYFLKHYLVIGNVVVAFLTAFVLIVIGLFSTLLFQTADPMTGMATQYIWQGILGYAAFAFVTNWIRELIKDIQDMRGDKYMGSRTLPVLIGDRQAKFVAIIMVLGLIRLILYPQQQYLEQGEMTLPLALIPVQALCLVAIAQLWLANSPQGYGRASLILKIIMLAGILTMPFYNILL